MTGTSDANAPLRFIVYWRQADWGFYHRRNEAFARALATRETVGEVVHLEAVSLKGVLACLLRALGSRDPGLRAVYRLHVRKALWRKPVAVSGKLAVQSILIATFSRHPLAQRLNRFLFRRQVARLRGIRPTVLLAYPPAHHLPDLVSALRPRLTLADLVDDVPALERDPGRRAASEHAFVEILPGCGAVFATSPRLAERYGAHAPCGIEFLPNGVKSAGAPMPEATAGNRRPRVAYTGSLNRSLDTALVEHLLASNPKVDFLLIGPVEPSAAAFVRRATETYPNCLYLGRKRHDELQRSLADCDVLVNLKRADTTTRGNDSIKIYEYLATGKPVVSTPMAPADRLTHLIHVAGDNETFQRLLRRALAENDPRLRAERRRIAGENTWERRVDRILARVGELLAPAAIEAREAGRG